MYKQIKGDWFAIKDGLAHHFTALMVQPCYLSHNMVILGVLGWQTCYSADLLGLGVWSTADYKLWVAKFYYKLQHGHKPLTSTSKPTTTWARLGCNFL